MNVCGVIVTYGNRFHLLSQVIDALRNEQIDQIIVVNNGAVENTVNGLKKLSVPVLTHHFSENTGSASAFKAGIERALAAGADYIWLLDDDTMPLANSLNSLKDFWRKEEKNKKEKITALCSYRKDRVNFNRVLVSGNPADILPPRNNFGGFHIKNLAGNMAERLVQRKIMASPQPVDSIAINAAPYGGLFFHKSLIEQIGLPDPGYVLYADDFDFTHRITKRGGEIIMVIPSVLTDIESSFYLPSKKKILYHSAYDSGSDSTAYYAVRNIIFFSKQNLVDNKQLYFVNKLLFTWLISAIGVLRGKFSRLKVIRSAIRDGQKSKIEVNPLYKI